MSFSTAELFQTPNGGKSNDNNNNNNSNNNIHKYGSGNSFKTSKNKNNNNYYNKHQPQSSISRIHHVPHNSHSDTYRSFKVSSNGMVNSNTLHDNIDAIQRNILNNDAIFQIQQAQLNNHRSNNNQYNNNNNNSNNSNNSNNNNLYKHKHNVSLASVHNRHNTKTSNFIDDDMHNFSNMLNDELDQINDDNIPSQKDIMKNFFQQNIEKHVHKQSKNFNNVFNDNNKDFYGHHADIDDEEDILNISNTIRSRSNVTTPLIDENDIINYMNDDNDEEISIEDYTSSDDNNNELDPMLKIQNKLQNEYQKQQQLNIQKQKQKQNKNNQQFPDTSPISNYSSNSNSNNKKRKKKKKNNFSPATPASVIIKSDVSDDSDDTYSSGQDTTPHPASHRGSTKYIKNHKLPSMSNSQSNISHNHQNQNQNNNNHPARSNTMSNMNVLMNPMKNKKKIQRHRSSRSEIYPSLKKKDLYQAFQTNTTLNKAFFAQTLTATKKHQSAVEKRARQEIEKKYKPELQKTRVELEEARRKSEKQEKEMQIMKEQLNKLKKENQLKKHYELQKKVNEKQVNKQLRERNLQIHSLNSKLKFEKEKHSLNTLNASGITSILHQITPNHTAMPKITSSVPFGPTASPSLMYSRSANFDINRDNNKFKLTHYNNNNHILSSTKIINRRHSARFLNNNKRLKDRANSKNNVRFAAGFDKLKKKISNKQVAYKKRKSLPKDLARKHKRPLWTDRSMIKSRTFDKDDEKKDDINKVDRTINKIKEENIFRTRLPKKRESLLLPPTTGFFARNQVKRNSWNGIVDTNKDKVDFDKLKSILQAAANKNKQTASTINNNNNNNKYMLAFNNIPTYYTPQLLLNHLLINNASFFHNNNNNNNLKIVQKHNNNNDDDNNNNNDINKQIVQIKNDYADMKSKYDHLMKENEMLRRENFKYKGDLKKDNKKKKKAIAPTPTGQLNLNGNILPNVPSIKKPNAIIERRKNKKNINGNINMDMNNTNIITGTKLLKQFPSLTNNMVNINWIPIEYNKIKDTKWKYINDNNDDIRIPKEFENIFSIKKVKKDNNNNNGSNDDDVDKKIKMKIISDDNDNKNDDNFIKFNRKSFKNKSFNISPKRSATVTLILNKKIKLSAKEIREAILNVDEKKLNKRILYNLLEIAPNLNEQKYVQNRMTQIQMNGNGNKNIDKLSFVESFFYELSDINHLELRISLWIFKSNFNDTINNRYNELYILLEALKSLQRSLVFDKLLSVILSFGNFMNSNKNKNKYGISGFKLESLTNLINIKSPNNDNDNDDDNTFKHSFLSYIYKYCRDNSKYNDCLNIINELKYIHRASAINTYDLHQKILAITEELSKFGRSLRKFRKAAIPSNNNNNNDNKPYPYRKIISDQFESYMRNFARKSQVICKELLDLWHECINIAQILSVEYNYNLNKEKIEDLLLIFSKFLTDFKKSKNNFEIYEYNLKKKQIILNQKNNISAKLSKFIKKRPSSVDLFAKKSIITNSDLMDDKLKKKEENKNILSKLIYEHAVLMEAKNNNNNNTDMMNDDQMSYQRIKYLKTLAKSNDLPNQLSNNPDAIQKQRRRRRSLSATDIQIGNNMAMTLAEDEEMK